MVTSTGRGCSTRPRQPYAFRPTTGRSQTLAERCCEAMVTIPSQPH